MNLAELEHHIGQVFGLVKDQSELLNMLADRLDSLAATAEKADNITAGVVEELSAKIKAIDERLTRLETAEFDAVRH